MKFSVFWPTMFLLGLFFCFSQQLQAWDPDYAYDLPKQRRMCAERKGNKVFFRSIFQDQDCPSTARRYIVVFGRNPRGAIGLLRSTTTHKFYPPLTLQWPTDQNPNRTRLWHFTCVGTGEREILETKIQLYRYLGELTADGKQDCLETEQRALNYCQKQLKGDRLLENCPISWGN